MAISKNRVVHTFYILPCCLLLLNLVNGIISYKAGVIADPLLRTSMVMLLVLFGSSLTAFVVAPALAAAVRWLHQSSRRNAGGLGEGLFFVALASGRLLALLPAEPPRHRGHRAADVAELTTGFTGARRGSRGMNPSHPFAGKDNLGLDDPRNRRESAGDGPRSRALDCRLKGGQPAFGRNAFITASLVSRRGPPARSRQ